jgi:hypothetical protein
MRHFHTNAHVNFSTYTVNGGEYVSFEDTIIAEVLVALSAAFGYSDSLAVKKSFGNEVLRWAEFSTILSANEYEVLVAAYQFYHFVKLSVESRGVDTQSRVFSYHNLNTGKSVVWSHFVC